MNMIPGFYWVRVLRDNLWEPAVLMPSGHWWYIGFDVGCDAEPGLVHGKPEVIGERLRPPSGLRDG